MKRLWKKTKAAFKSIYTQLKDRTNIIIFLSVFIVLSSEVWGAFLLGVITGSAWWYGLAAACWAFWLAPFTPFLTICIALTFAIRKMVDGIKKRKEERKAKEKQNK